MAKKFHLTEVFINNFRTLKHFHSSDFGQVNLITGRNNSGKTSLLEALFLALGPGNPQLWMNINNRRGLSVIGERSSTIPYLFHQLNVKEPIIINISTKDYSSYSVEIKSQEAENTLSTGLPTGTFPDAYEDVNTNPNITNNLLTITYKPQTGEPIISTARVMDNQIEFSRYTKIFPTCVFLSPEAGGVIDLDARRFDNLNKKGLSSGFEKLLTQFLPTLKRVSLGLENNNPVILVDVGFGLVPLNILGSGAKRLASILLAINDASNAVVLIDEIESGFHHSFYHNVWRTIIDFAQSQHTQLFATTHSDEFIRSSIDVIHKSNIDFQLHRMSTDANNSEFKTFAREEFESAIEGGWDVR